MHHHLLIRHFEIKPPLLRSEAIKRLAVALDFSKPLIVQMLQIIPRDLELIQEFQLSQGVELGDLSRTDFVEDNL